MRETMTAEKHQWRRMYPQTPKPTCVYKLRWSDSAEYVGITSTPLSNRLRDHCHQGCNQEVTQRLQNRNYPQVVILAENLTTQEALKYEQSTLNNHQRKHKLLNWHYQGGHLNSKKH